eukprot:5215961-Pyramimonas_sp.AAC.1
MARHITILVLNLLILLLLELLRSNQNVVVDFADIVNNIRTVIGRSSTFGLCFQSLLYQQHPHRDWAFFNIRVVFPVALGYRQQHPHRDWAFFNIRFVIPVALVSTAFVPAINISKIYKYILVS